MWVLSPGCGHLYIWHWFWKCTSLFLILFLKMEDSSIWHIWAEPHPFPFLHYTMYKPFNTCEDSINTHKVQPTLPLLLPAGETRAERGKKGGTAEVGWDKSKWLKSAVMTYLMSPQLHEVFCRWGEQTSGGKSSVFIEASLEKKGKVMLKAGAAVGGMGAGSFLARKLKQPCGGSCYWGT